MLGGFQQQEINEEHILRINNYRQQINSRLGSNSEGYKIEGIWMQVVGGLNYFYHLTDQSNGNKYSICLYVYNQDPAQILIAQEGHNPARNPNSMP